ncbi:galactosyltransferase-related protein [Bdellovibrio sp. HCB2-146]|uniref:galactosyltransferase-related protein n=1 Tax=Bdellovibrio sp. HCB2-146 TaxID=3394362 RepID=UPI0039BCE4CE
MTSSLSKSDLSSMSQDTKVKWLFSYKISHEDLQKNLQLIRSMGLPLQTSDFLELSCEESLDNWYSPKISDIQSNASEASINTSIIVPFQDNYDEVLQTLPLLIQSLKDEASTEIIVANDSFSLEQENRILEILKSDARYFTYLKIERSKPRVKGDAQFRAGVVRNLAAYLAQGQELIFLDSDIIVGKNLWTAIHTARKTHNGALMPRRHFLRSDIENSSLSYELIQKGCHTQLSWGGHWEDFYRNSHVPDSWKWTSTYCLALPRALFDEVGGFGRAFSSYGFEDTDLGYRLLRHGQSLQVLNQDVFHLPFPASRSEYASHFEERKKLLKKSFGAFLRSSMNPDLLSQFRHILN